jgi:hypothetical protein
MRTDFRGRGFQFVRNLVLRANRFISPTPTTPRGMHIRRPHQEKQALAFFRGYQLP